MNWVIFIKTKPITKLINTSFRPFTQQDVDSVLAIERLVYASPWNKTKFIDSINNKQTLASLIVTGDKVLGYMVALRSVDSADLLNICVHPDYQHRGLGRALFNYLVQQLQLLGINDIFIEVRQSNHSALLFYQTMGFEAIDIRKKYYSNLEDAKILRLQIM